MRLCLQTQVREDLLDHRLLQDRSDDLQLTATVRAVLQVELESEASAKTNLYSSDVVAKTRLSSRAQLSHQAEPPNHNVVVAGQWQADAPDALTVEEGLMQTLKLGDRFAFDMGGQVREGRITSMQRVLDRVIRAVEFLSGFTLATGPVVDILRRAAQ